MFIVSNNLIKKIVGILFIFLPIIFNIFGFDVFALPRLFFLYFATLILLIAIFAQWIQSGKIEIRYGKIFKFLTTFVFFVLLSVILSQDKQTALFGYVWDYEGLFSWLSYFILFYAGFVYFRETKDIKKIFLALSLPLLLVGSYSILQYFYDLQLMDWSQKTEINRASSFLGHPSYLGIYCIILLPLIFSLIREKFYNIKIQSLLIISFISGLFGLILSFSRGAWVAFVVMLFLFLILNLSKAKKIIVAYKKITTSLIVLISFLFFLLISGIIENNLVSIIGQRFLSIFDPKSATTQVRLALYKQSFSLLKDYWLFGIGPDNYTYVISQYFLKSWSVFREMVADKAHNQIIDYWISFGIFGLISYLSFLFYWLKQSLKTLQKISGTEKFLFHGIILSVVGYLVTVQFHYSTIDLAPFFWFLLGIGSGLTIKFGAQEEKIKILFCQKNKNWFIFKNIFYTTSLIIFCTLSYFSYQKISADYFFAKALQNKESLEKSISLLELSINKNNTVTNYYLALSSYYLEKGKQNGDYLYFEKAIDVLKNGNNTIPLDYRITYQLGETYLKIVNYTENKDYVYNQSKEAYLKTKNLYPNWSEVYLKLGVVSAYLNQDDQAFQYWQNCIDLDKKQAQCYYNLHVISSKIGNDKLSEEYYKQYQNLLQK